MGRMNRSRPQRIDLSCLLGATCVNNWRCIIVKINKIPFEDGVHLCQEASLELIKVIGELLRLEIESQDGNADSEIDVPISIEKIHRLMQISGAVSSALVSILSESERIRIGNTDEVQ